MEHSDRQERIAAMSKTILSYCIARTSNRADAEDLSQEILCELIRSSAGLQNDEAFYGFMWSVARNVWRQWARRRTRMQSHEETVDLSLCADTLADKTESEAEEDETIVLLRRELSLLSARYRRATVLYYLRRLSCAEIADELSVSESMVKYLLFKARNILKEGMVMERNYGTQSYDPKHLTLYYMGEGPNRHWDLIHGQKIRQNILWACYHDALTEQEIALEIGVALPYIEEDIRLLTDAWLLQKTGRHYRTNLILLSEDFERERGSLLLPIQKQIAERICRFVAEHEADIRALGFTGHTMAQNTLRWQMATMLLYAAFHRYNHTVCAEIAYPQTAFGEHAYLWGVETVKRSYSTCGVGYDDCRLTLSFMDWYACPQSDHHDFWGKPQRLRLLETIVSGDGKDLHPLEEEIAAELIRGGYLTRTDDGLAVTMPIYTASQLEALEAMQEDAIADITALYGDLQVKNAAVLKNHVPTHLKGQVEAIAAMNLLDEGAGTPTYCLLRDGWLSMAYTPNELGTVYGVFEN